MHNTFTSFILADSQYRQGSTHKPSYSAYKMCRLHFNSFCNYINYVCSSAYVDSMPPREQWPHRDRQEDLRHHLERRRSKSS